MALLDVPESVCRRILEACTTDVAEHPIRHEHLEVRIARAEIHIGKPVVVQVAVVAAHRRHDPVEAHGFGDIGERAVTLVAMQAGMRRRAALPEILRRHIGKTVSGWQLRTHGGWGSHKQVEPPVVIVVEEPCREAVPWLSDTGGGRQVAERPPPIRRRPLVVEQVIWFPEARDVEIEAAVVVVVAPWTAALLRRLMESRPPTSSDRPRCGGMGPVGSTVRCMSA